MRKIFTALTLIIFVLLSTTGINAQTLKGYTRQTTHTVNFGTGANNFTIKAASRGWGGELALRLDAPDGPIIGRVFFNHTGISSAFPDSSAHFLNYSCKLSQTVSGAHTVYMNIQDYAEPILGGKLSLSSFSFSMLNASPVVGSNRLNIYPDVPGLSPSPYYEYGIQKVNALNSANLAEVTNWLKPFAWFSDSPLKGAAGYTYAGYVGGWSQTYTNFELDPNTPIVIKITRKAVTGNDAPAGPIKSAVVHPAHKVEKCELINGVVYVTMKNPAFITVDIDGQMDTRKVPRATFDGWGSDAFPNSNSRAKGCHAVSIFANPVIEDKPNINDPNVLVIRAGQQIPSDINTRNWTTLYFEPGVHKLSTDLVNGTPVERQWKLEDVIILKSNRTVYVPGNALVYGNFSNNLYSNQGGDNIRLYGHGTISGSKILFWGSWPAPNNTENFGYKTRPLVVDGATNVRVEGITMQDPAFHTITITNSLNKDYTPNYIRWTKVLAWRCNTDATAIAGNTILEDCFLRSQDDGHYTGGTPSMKRVVFWHDVNGCTFRGDLLGSRYSKDNAASIPKEILIEDIDIIYARGVFLLGDYAGTSIIQDGEDSFPYLKDGVKASGQMVHFRNINVEDPLPVRNLFGYGGGYVAGIRFENIKYTKQCFDRKSGIVGLSTSPYRNFVFDNVSMGGHKFGTANVIDPTVIETNEYLKDMTYRLRYKISSANYTLITSSTNGLVVIDTITKPGNVIVKSVPLSGYKFIGWSGDLATTDSIATITMNSDKAITANYKLISYTITKSPTTNGSIVFEPNLKEYLPGTVVTVKAVGNLGWGINSWGGDLSGSEYSKIITMNGDKNVSAIFKVVPTYKISTKATNGSIILDSAGEVYNQGTDVTVTAKAEYGYEFVGWSGDLTDNENPTTIMVDSDKQIIANFKTKKGEKLVMAINCGGSAFTSDDGVLYKADHSFVGGGVYKSQDFIANTQNQTLYQSERTGNFSYNLNLPNGTYDVTLMFAEIFWGGPGSRSFNVSMEGLKVINQLDIYSKVGKNKPYEETHRVKLTDGILNISFAKIIDNAKISAIKVVSPGTSFNLQTNALNGYVSIYPPGGIYDTTTVVTLTAKANAGYKFSEWSGDLVGSTNPISLAMNAQKNVTANFVPLSEYRVSSEAINGSIVFNPTGDSYAEGKNVSVTAIADKGYQFVGWKGDLSGLKNPESMIMNANKTISALFEKIPNYALTANVSNGEIILDPAGGQYEKGTVVSVTVVPDYGYDFIGWSGDLTGKSNTASLLMNTNKEITAVIVPKLMCMVNIMASNGTVTIEPSADSYLIGTSITLQATPNGGYEFSEWTGDITGASNPVSIILNGHKNISAIFQKKTSVNEIGENIDQRQLIQIYPNPFSTKATITYQIQEATDVELSVFDVFGREVSVVVKEFQSSGSYSVDWLVSDHQYSKGMYFFKLTTNKNNTQTIKASMAK